MGDTLAKATLRDSDHIGMWEGALKVAECDHQSQLDARQAEIHSLSEQLATQRRLVEDLRYSYKNERGLEAESVRRWLDDARVFEAEEKRDAAFRSRDRAMAHLWMINELHHAIGIDELKCSCGRRTNGCREWQAMARIVGPLYSWEQKQKERQAAGLPHGLPDEYFGPSFRRAGS
ncbi:hypothetical protein [Nocardia altamirensis]|uniref:hypothetical protein n=1 Tax=Nocardia altamirensis TaxID=472158 RepID=UPI00084009DF|nr:hypothetical protein [Nocardia altamirensis]